MRFAGSAGDLERLLAGADVALLLLDREQSIRWFTPATRSLFSFLPADIGRPIRDLSQKFSDPLFLSEVRRVLEGGAVPRREVQSTEGHWYVRQILPWRRESGSIEGALVTFSDVVAEALQEARLYAEAIVQAMRQPLAILDPNLYVQSLNDPLCALLGIQREEAVGHSFAEIAGRLGDAGALVPLLKDVAAGGTPVAGLEVPIESGADDKRTLLLHAHQLEKKRAMPGLVLVTIDDVTEQRRMQGILSENEAQRVEQENVRQRQVQLTNALRVSTVGELATGLAHELNQPLASISNVVEACSRHVRAGTIDPSRLLELLSDVASESMRAAGIVAHLRSFIEKGEPQLERIDLSQIVGNVPHLLLRELERSRIALRINLPAGQLPIHADRIQIEQVIVNLIQNAMDSIQEADTSQRLIELSARASKGMGEVSIRDTGTGLSQAAAERVFEAFFTTKKHGLGMGLALSRSILEVHRGRIWIETPPDGGPGAVVRFAIPLKDQRQRRKDRNS